MENNNKDLSQEAYDAVLDREFDFVDWCDDAGEDEIRDEYVEKAYDLWDRYTGEAGDDTLDRLTALLDEYEERANYTRPVKPNDDDDSEEEISPAPSSGSTVSTRYGGNGSARRNGRRNKGKAGCIVPVVFVVMFFMTIMFFVSNNITGGIISFFTLFAFLICFVIGVFARERIMFSTNIDPDKYEYKNGVIEDCYLSSTTRVNNNVYKTFVLTLNVEGRSVTAYARKSHRKGETVHLAVRKDKPLAKVVDLNGKAVYRYNYDYYRTPDPIGVQVNSSTVEHSAPHSTSRSTVERSTVKQSAAKPTVTKPTAEKAYPRERQTSAKSTAAVPHVTQTASPYKKPVTPYTPPVEPPTEVIMPTHEVEELCTREDKLIGALEDLGLFVTSSEYRKEAEEFWNEYRGGKGDDDDLLLDKISELIDKYSAMYVDTYKSAMPTDSGRSFATTKTRVSASVAKSEKTASTEDKEKSRIEKSVEETERKPADKKPADKPAAARKYEKPDYRSHKRAGGKVSDFDEREDMSARDINASDGEANMSDSAKTFDFDSTTPTADEKRNYDEIGETKDSALSSDDADTVSVRPSALSAPDISTTEPNEHIPSDIVTPKSTGNAATGRRVGYKPTKKK